jgi:hypothetical protein
MTSHVGRLYTLALALVVFFLAWAVVAARPWATTTASPRLQALAVREAQLRRDAQLVNQIVAARAHTSHASVPAPAVKVVNLPPLTITRTS